MKRTISLLTCLSLALPAYSETGDREPASASNRLANVRISSLILTKEEFKKLNSKDKATYIMSMMALTQIIEASQGQVMSKTADFQKVAAIEKLNREVRAVAQTTETKSQRPAWFEFFISSAFAVDVASAIKSGAAKVAGPLLDKLSWVPAKTGTYVQSAKSYVSNLTAHVTKVKAAPQLKFDGKTQADTDFLVSAGQMIDQGAKLLRDKTLALEAAQKAKSPGNVIAKIESEIKTIEASLKTNRLNYLDRVRPEDKDKADTAIRGIVDHYSPMFSGAAKERFKQAGLVGGGVAAGAGGSAVINNGNPSDMAQALTEDEADQAQLAASDAAAKAKAAAKVSPREATLSCIYGNRPSTWKEYQIGNTTDIRCQRPANSRCKGKKGDSWYQCPTYGLYVGGVSIEKDACIKLSPLDDLSVRCQKAIDTRLSAGPQVEVDADKLEEQLAGLAEVAKKIEDSKFMNSENGDPKTAEEYCEGAKSTQEKECQALLAVITSIRKTAADEFIKLRDRNSAATATAPAAAANAEPGAPAPGGKTEFKAPDAAK